MSRHQAAIDAAYDVQIDHAPDLDGENPDVCISCGNEWPCTPFNAASQVLERLER